ncbi:hypothetical protein GMOD_00004309 [Pyrenophora seminiperda CCB06]|uniref:Uncharacterized protein n=1 Tax=Pyrenophora seminiperda CCB06 TaxID=1302712 RepID=A0A3M7M0Z7_9PLEO|nr:hypothetical protein GMOD_00004309 [Pyrenophora seminiperda CCB06]
MLEEEEERSSRPMSKREEKPMVADGAVGKAMDAVAVAVAVGNVDELLMCLNFSREGKLRTTLKYPWLFSV